MTAYKIHGLDAYKAQLNTAIDRLVAVIADTLEREHEVPAGDRDHVFDIAGTYCFRFGLTDADPDVVRANLATLRADDEWMFHRAPQPKHLMRIKLALGSNHAPDAAAQFYASAHYADNASRRREAYDFKHRLLAAGKDIPEPQADDVGAYRPLDRTPPAPVGLVSPRQPQQGQQP